MTRIPFFDAARAAYPAAGAKWRFPRLFPVLKGAFMSFFSFRQVRSIAQSPARALAARSLLFSYTNPLRSWTFFWEILFASEWWRVPFAAEALVLMWPSERVPHPCPPFFTSRHSPLFAPRARAYPSPDPRQFRLGGVCAALAPSLLRASLFSPNPDRLRPSQLTPCPASIRQFSPSGR